MGRSGNWTKVTSGGSNPNVSHSTPSLYKKVEEGS